MNNLAMGVDLQQRYSRHAVVASDVVAVAVAVARDWSDRPSRAVENGGDCAAAVDAHSWLLWSASSCCCWCWCEGVCEL